MGHFSREKKWLPVSQLMTHVLRLSRSSRSDTSTALWSSRSTTTTPLLSLCSRVRRTRRGMTLSDSSLRTGAGTASTISSSPTTTVDSGKITFVVWTPDVCRIKEKMLYAGTKDAIKKKLEGIQCEVQATDNSEIEFDVVKEKASRFE